MITDEIAEFLINHGIDLVISLDGPREIHNKNRVFAKDGEGTFDAVMDRLQHLHSEYLEFFKKISINMVIDPENDFNDINNLFTEYSFLKDCRFQSSIIDDSFTSKSNTYTEEFVLKNNYHEFLAYLSSVNRIDREKISPISIQVIDRAFDNIDRMLPTICLPKSLAPGGPCIPGEVRPMLNVDGNIIPCERVSEVSDSMIIGNINSGIDINKVKNILNIGALTPNECRNCWAFLHCNICAKAVDDNGKLSAKKKMEHCDSSRFAAEHKFREMIFLSEIQKY